MLCDEHMPPGAGNPFGDYSPSLVSLTVGAVMAMTGLDKTVGGVSSAMHWALAGFGSKAFMEGGTEPPFLRTQYSVLCAIAVRPLLASPSTCRAWRCAEA